MGFTCAAALLMPGCRRDESASSSTGAVGDEQLSAGGTAADDQRPRGVDSQDDHRTPRALPKSNDIPGWVKSEPARLVEFDEVVRGDPTWAGMRRFRIRRMVRCAYDAEEGAARADVLFIEAATPDDAFGIFSLLTRQPGKLSNDGKTMRSIEVTPAGTVMAGWHGWTCVRIEFTGTDVLQDDPAYTSLCDRILFHVPASDDSPLMVGILSRQGLAGTKIWLVRSVAALARSGEKTLQSIDASAMDVRLGLDGNATLSVAAVRVGADEPHNLVWLVHYEDAAQAAAARERYRRALATGEGQLDMNTIITDPKGLFLAGSWTASQESIQNQLPVLGEALPGE